MTQTGANPPEKVPGSIRAEVLPPISALQPEKAEGGLKSLGWTIVAFVGVGLLLAIVVLLLKGIKWASEALLPWLMAGAGLVLVIDVVFLLPLSLFRRLRVFTGASLQWSSLLFGLTTWLSGFLLTYALWGGFWVGVGMLFFGIGVVPMAMLATLFKGMWAELIALVIMVVMTFGVRGAGLAISAAAED
jgi:hypothetical protein